jgi:hypothetical protein
MSRVVSTRLPAMRRVAHGRLLYGLAVGIVFSAAIVFSVVSTRPPAVRSESVRSSGPTPTSLDALVDGSDVVVLARAVAVNEGRLFAADSGPSGVRSHLVVLEVGAVLAGELDGSTLTLEEEATTDDGRQLVVDGLRPTRLGDQGIFFLERSTDSSTPYYATVSTAGRYLRRSTDDNDDSLEGAALAGPLAKRIAAMGGRALTDAIVERARATQRPVDPLPS